MAKTKKTPKKTSAKQPGAVARVWEIASAMPKAARKDVIAACLKAGLNEHTAKTQYQRWLHRADKPKKTEPKKTAA